MLDEWLAVGWVHPHSRCPLLSQAVLLHGEEAGGLHHLVRSLAGRRVEIDAAHHQPGGRDVLQGRVPLAVARIVAHVRRPFELRQADFTVLLGGLGDDLLHGGDVQ